MSAASAEAYFNCGVLHVDIYGEHPHCLTLLIGPGGYFGWAYYYSDEERESGRGVFPDELLGKCKQFIPDNDDE